MYTLYIMYTLHIAACKENLEIIKLLLSHKEININDLDEIKYFVLIKF